MAPWNHTRVTEFILLGITVKKELELPLFVVFFLIYGATLIGNLGIILLIQRDPQLHTPMYFFLSNLAFVDISYSTAITPNMLMGLLTERKSIAVGGCAAQLFLCILCGSSECLLLAVMAYDRYVAICTPLHYLVIMSQKRCLCLVIGSYFLSIFYAALHITFTFTLYFCGSNVIDHFLCEIPALLKLSCSDTHLYEIVIFVQVSINSIGTTMIVLISYTCILATVLKINSSESRHKALSTCTSHLIVVSLFYGAIFFMYLQPNSAHTLERDKMASLFYTVVTPMLNPLIYSLRNKEVKTSFQRQFLKTFYS